MKSRASFLSLFPLLLSLSAQAALPDCPTIRITAPSTLAGATAGNAYSTTLTQTGSSDATFAVSAGSLPSGLLLDADGTLDGTPTQAGNFVFTALATDTASGCSGGRVYALNVITINHAPSFTPGGPQTVLEDAGAQTVNGWASAISQGPGDTGQTLSFIVTGNSNAALFSTAPAIDAATGNLTYRPAADASGTANITVTLHDDGGTANGGIDTSPPQTFAINVTAVNDAPSFTAGANAVVSEDSGAASLAWATAISAGPANEAAQTLTFTANVTTGAGLFSVAPAISPTGQLTFTPAANAYGTATVSVTLQDNGGSGNGGVDTSAAQTFTITATAVDDAPVAQGDSATVAQDSGATAIDVLANDTDIDGGPKLVTAITQPANGTVVITGGGTGLTYEPDAGYANDPPTEPEDTFTYTLDGGSTANVGVTVNPLSGDIDVGAYHINGSCGTLGLLGPGFTLTAGSAPLPVGTTVTITGSGVPNIGVFSVTGGTANVAVLSGTARQITLTSALPAGATMAFRTTLSITVAFTLSGVTSLPAGYVATGAKPTGSVSSTLILCSAT
ncbi:MAG TPA: Ig-like domain-containing protein [Tahibacter sp.]|nr:Ig-like domain-containing protein [Tahibacter sp.]